MVATVCLLIASSVKNSSSSPHDLICLSSTVVMFMCKSSVALHAVSSGSCVTALLRCVACVERSLSPHSFSLRIRGKRHKCRQLCDVIDITHTCRSRDLCGILFISIELHVNVFCNLGEGVRSIFCPKKSFALRS